MKGKFIAPAGAGTPSPKGIYIGGTFGFVSYGTGASCFNSLGVFNSDFTLDQSAIVPTFSNNTSGNTNYTNQILEQPDGKILVCGIFYSYDNKVTSTLRILRLNPDFTLDTTFSGLANNSVLTMALQADGKILIGGFFTFYGGTSINRIARLNSDGTLDTSFVVGTGFNNAVRDIKIQSDGKILVCGEFTSYNGVTINRLIRLETNGSVDATFNIGSGFDGRVNKIALQSDGKIFVVGSFSSFQGVSVTARNKRLRLNTDGSFDSSFNAIGDNITSILYDVKILTDGTIIVVGFVGTTTVIRKYSSSGVFDSAFNSNVTYSTGQSNNYPVYALEISQDNKLILAGDFGAFQGRISNCFVVLNQDGTIFKTSPIMSRSGQFDTVYRLSSGKILFGGNVFATVPIESNGINVFRNVVKLSNYNTLSNDYYLKRYASAGQSTGSTIKIFIDDSDQLYINDGQFGNGGIILNKYDSSGNTINNFNGDYSAINNTVSDFALLQDGSVVVVGNFTLFKEKLINRIIKLDSNGLIDNTFATNIGTGFIQSVTSVAVTNDQKIYAGGTFFSYNGSSVSRFVRLNSDGTRDTSFVAASNTMVTPIKILVQGDGKLIILGGITAYGGVSVKGIVRTNVNGTLDTSFNVGGTGFDELSSSLYPYCGFVQTDGKILIGGRFNSYNGNPVSGIVRLNSNGSFDNTFNQGSGFVGIGSNSSNELYPLVNDIKQLSDGKIIVVGDFLTYNNNIAKSYCVLDYNGNFIESNIHIEGSPSSIFIKN
jgi:uncharacterized delta-60 repeat protein